MRFAFALALLFGVSSPASAEIFKYVKPNGTVVYTDSLAQLPKERRIHYNKLLAEREKAEREVRKEVAAEQEARRKAEAERRRLRAEADARNAARLREIDATIARLRAKNKVREEKKAEWRARIEATEKKLEARLVSFAKLQEEYTGLATKADFTLFPGGRQRKLELKAQLEALEKEIDGLINELQVEIPEAARKAGVPPGWVRR
ncbi:MAG: DUF4124 domain-containing protein [Myxococcota bacterium]